MRNYEVGDVTQGVLLERPRFPPLPLSILSLLGFMVFRFLCLPRRNEKA
jgi:hypothetical protein